ncbi:MULTISPECIES: DUF6233 domain-containing protein [Streptomyces]|uniref:DUF6233 domain-containing protein n=1 Tax=Streptomyces mirabilis TaxID=68239 RepID=A0ABU3UCB0_9ACTN|nr:MULTISPECIES: DUF6233 domain-containing protein [Streptomyces]MCX4616647.1 DUF6233 domain-containing protein [Streptomyces mirabilis]MCX5354873.1 DUF6233 domain-containing protein [Streptomyces mirabilis]MDU8991556.1 DUF6233 domain-containing protein [Streptomyces mirabilis]
MTDSCCDPDHGAGGAEPGRPGAQRDPAATGSGSDWTVELGIGNGRPPIEVHVGDCYAAGKRRHPVPRDEVRRLLTSGVRACTHCMPDAQLRILD